MFGPVDPLASADPWSDSLSGDFNHLPSARFAETREQEARRKNRERKEKESLDHAKRVKSLYLHLRGPGNTQP